ncbi:hypothetical protein BBF96_08035 [Anoxybacter fermentans]|uniref:Methyltransferase type 11 domain-containing protein n=1 Tax=Anoxybacter fermentans TaxID=1323375 RepID=A0A3S9T2V1_9FIRM|nr:hypothetical protein BBF96_08035 [Anoxybacter fermentans]
MKTNGFILDLGGGGEGIIGKLNGRQVVAIDMREEELQEIKNDALKIVMDARNLKFLPESFDICTSFFSLMYIPESDHVKVFKEVYQVLKSNRKFLIWDVEIPEKQKGYDIFVVQLKIFLPNEEIETGYGVKWDKQQNSEYFKKLAKETGFKLINEWHKDKIFYLEMVKNV